MRKLLMPHILYNQLGVILLTYLVFILMSHCNRGGGLTLQMSLHLSMETLSVYNRHTSNTYSS